MEDTAQLPTPDVAPAAPAVEATAPAETPAPVAEAQPPTPAPDYAAENARLSEELSKKSADYDTLRTQHDAFVRRTSLEGKVTDMNLALKVLDPDRHLNQDGTVNADALYSDFPILSPFMPTRDTAPDGGGGPQISYGDTELDAAAETGNRFAINTAFDRLLKGGRK